MLGDCYRVSRQQFRMEWDLGRGGRIGYITPTVWGVPNAQSGEQNQQWPTSGHIGYISPTI